MPDVPILMPQLGESIAEATIVRLNVAEGEQVDADQEVIEVETNKATMEVTTLCSGTVREILVEEGVSYPVGTVLGLLDVTAEEVAAADDHDAAALVSAERIVERDPARLVDREAGALHSRQTIPLMTNFDSSLPVLPS